ncbi:unnamed protein product [Moneuplotes crassus]|uniref:Uncharacterized protein n=1 Tax=Euplotes crassus TaxID=5936 RepID=A0AAD1Y5F7_EUPCR|nr:unnamed protein product [Moneuplotes crassus]
MNQCYPSELTKTEDETSYKDETENGTMTARDLIPEYMPAKSPPATESFDLYAEVHAEASSLVSSMDGIEAYNYRDPELRYKMVSMEKQLYKLKKMANYEQPQENIIEVRKDGLTKLDQQAEILEKENQEIRAQLDPLKEEMVELRAIMSNLQQSLDLILREVVGFKRKF